MVNTQRQIEDIIRTINALPEQVTRAAALSLNRVADWMKSQTSRTISKEQRIKLKLIRDRIKVSRASKRSLQSLLNCDFQGVKAIDLGKPRQTKPGTVVAGRLFKHAFIARLKKGGAEGVYRRVGKKRFPLISARVEIYDDAVNIVSDLLGTEAGAVFEKRFVHEIQRLTGAMV